MSKRKPAIKILQLMGDPSDGGTMSGAGALYDNGRVTAHVDIQVSRAIWQHVWRRIGYVRSVIDRSGWWPGNGQI